MKTINQRTKKLAGKVKHIVKENEGLIVGLSNEENIRLSDYIKNKFDITQGFLIDYVVDLYGTPIKTKAKCKEPDKFDKHIGMDIVDLKIMLKFHKQACNKLINARKYFMKLNDRIYDKIMEEAKVIYEIENKLNKYSKGDSNNG